MTLSRLPRLRTILFNLPSALEFHGEPLVTDLFTVYMRRYIPAAKVWHSLSNTLIYHDKVFDIQLYVALYHSTGIGGVGFRRVLRVPPLMMERMHNSRFRVQRKAPVEWKEEEGAIALRQWQENRRSRFSIILEKVLEEFQPRGQIRDQFQNVHQYQVSPRPFIRSFQKNTAGIIA